MGIWAVKLCSHGYFGPLRAIEGKFGYARAVSDVYDLKKIAGFAESNGILNTGIKPYACCRQHHSAIDAILELKEQHSLKPREVKHIVVRTFAVASRGSHQRPDTMASATYSAPFILARRPHHRFLLARTVHHGKDKRPPLTRSGGKD